MAIKGKNDLLTLNPDLAKEWNYDLNKELKTENVTEKKRKKVSIDKSEEYQRIKKELSEK